jgi:hypothetical protein
VASIDEALTLYQDLKLDTYQYAAHKEKFLALLDLNENDAAQVELNTVLSWFERNRKEISEESYKNKFFDTGQNTYELAIDFQISEKADAWKGFEYAESAHARSLLELATSGGSAAGDAANPELSISAETSPLTLQEIQLRFPPQAQLLEYSVLDNKVIVWLVTKDQKDYSQTEVSREELNEKIRSYLKAIRGNDSGSANQIGKELYAKLIAPIETN